MVVWMRDGGEIMVGGDVARGTDLARRNVDVECDVFG